MGICGSVLSTELVKLVYS